MNRSRRLIASILTCLMLVTVFLGVENTKRTGSVGAAINTWEQTDWSGGVDAGTDAVHPTDQLGWNKYASVTNVSGTDSLGNAVLSTGDFTVTDDGTLTSTGSATGGGFVNGTTSSTSISGSGAGGSVGLTATTTVINSFETAFPPVPGNVRMGGGAIRNGVDDDIYVLQGNSATGFYKYSVSGNSWTTLTAVPGAVSYGGTMIRNGADNDIYVLAGGNTTGFYKYSISGNSWTTLTSVPGSVYYGSSMIRNGADNDIYVNRGVFGGFYKYSISGNSWTTLAAVLATFGDGSSMIRNGADDDIYALTTGGTGFYKYSISGNSWTTLTAVPAAVGIGGLMIRNGADDEIYVLRGNSTGFYKYSISGNSWITLTSITSTVNNGSLMIRNGAENDIYVLTGWDERSFKKYSISSNTWSTLAYVPGGGVSYGSAMVRNGSDNDIYVLSGGNNKDFNKYSISGNVWTGRNSSGLAPVPGAISSNSAMLRNGTDNDMYVLAGGSTTSFYKYSISGNSWATLTNVPAIVESGARMIRNGADDAIFVYTGGNATKFYRYSISGNSWTTLTIPNGPGSIGSQIIRNGSDNDIYLLGGGGTNFKRYSISGNSWTTLTAVPGTVSTGSAMIRNGADDDIYVLRGNSSTGFYKYSISGNSWTTLTVVPKTVSFGSAMVRNGADNDIYVLSGNASSFYKYSISSNSWTTLAVVPATVGDGSSMLRNGSDNDIYVIQGALSHMDSVLYKYSISGNTWSTLITLPSPLGVGGVMMRNGSDNQIYFLQGNSSTNLWRYTIDSVSYPTSGTFTSAVIDTAGVTVLGNLSWTSTLPASTTLTFATRTGATSTPDGTWSAWSSELSTSAGSAIMSPAARYIQYRGSFATSDAAATPSLADISMAYSAYQSSGDLVSSAYNSIDLDNVISGFAWTEDAALPVGTSVTVSLRTASASVGLTGAWTDFTNATTDCGKSGDTVTCTTAAIPASLKSGGDDQYVQYKLALATTDAAVTPTVGSVVTTYGVQTGSRNRGQGVITVVKTVINDNGGTKDFDDFPLFVNDLLVISGVSNTFPVTGGLFTVTETADTNYLQTFSGSCDSDGNMNLGSGDNKLCIVTNDDIGGGSGGDPSVPPLIDVVKVPSPLSLPTAPGAVTYTYTVNNVGTVPMTEVSMLDDSCSPIILISGDTNTNSILEVSETWIYSCSRTVSQTHTNTVVATGWANGLSATDIASATVVVGTSVTPPLIHVTKVPNPLALPIGGGLVTYTEQVSNPGIVALTNVTLTDDKCGPMKYISGDSNNDSRLDPTETWTYTCTTNLTQTTTNTATASGTANGLTVRDYAIVTVVVAPSAAALSYDVGLALSSSPTINIEKSLLAPSPDPAVHCVSGALIKAATDDNAGTQVDSTVYACGLDGKRYAFPDESTYFSWYPDFSGVQILSTATLAAIPRGGNVTYRPGSRLLKVASNSKVYAVAKGGVLRWVTSEAVAQALYGVNWNTKIDDIPLALFDLSYSVGLPINLADVGPTIAECTTTTTFTKTLTQGSTDAQVRPLQSLLQCLGHFPAGTAPTGYFGPVTQSAVKSFQSANGLPQTGSTDTSTREGLNSI